MTSARVNETAIQTIHDLEEQNTALENKIASLEATIEMQQGELQRAHDANLKIAAERDHFYSFGTEIATRVHVLQEVAQAIMIHAEQAPWKPKTIKTPRAEMPVDERLKNLASMLAPKIAGNDDDETVEEPSI